ncbi:MAG: hypothetical protein ACOYNN_13460 [Terrimicrobiaceae bacterium]
MGNSFYHGLMGNPKYANIGIQDYTEIEQKLAPNSDKYPDWVKDRMKQFLSSLKGDKVPQLVYPEPTVENTSEAAAVNSMQSMRMDN